MLAESPHHPSGKTSLLDTQALALQSLKDNPLYPISDTDPRTAVISDCLATITTFFLMDYGAFSDSATKGRWWEVSAQDLHDELDHYNSWANWEATERGQVEEFIEVSIEQLFVASQQRLEMVDQVESANQNLTVIYQHLHEMIRQAAADETEVARLIADWTKFLAESS